MIPKYDQLKKQKGKGGKAASSKKKDDQPEDKERDGSTKEEDLKEKPEEASGAENAGDEHQETADKEGEEQAEAAVEPKQLDDSPETPQPQHHRQPSLSVQSKMRSSSFRRSSLSQGPMSPATNGAKSPDLPPLTSEGDSVNSIYRKQSARLDELEKENRRLAKDLQDGETRWRKTDEELEELREASGEVAELKTKAKKLGAQTEELAKFKQENTSLQRQNSQLQSQTSKRHASSPSQSNASSPFASLQSQLDSKSSTIESMEMEISNLRSQLSASSTSSSSHSEQIRALEAKLERAERAAGAAQRELADAKKNLDRASEKAVREGTEKTSAETKIRNLTRETNESKQRLDESVKRVEVLEKKLAALTNMHKDVDGRRQAGERERERLEKEASEMRRRFAGIENENLRLRDEREKARKRDASGADNEGLDELEDDERRKLETKVRELEGEVSELRRGIWREKRREMQDGPDAEDAVGSPGSKFDDVDLSGPSPYRRQSMAGRQGSSFQDVLASGLNAFTGGNRGSEELLDDFDDAGFDEDAFRRAQEEEAKKRVERIKEIKRSLKDWEGYRIDIVDLRSAGGGGIGEIFDV